MSLHRPFNLFFFLHFFLSFFLNQLNIPPKIEFIYEINQTNEGFVVSYSFYTYCWYFFYTMFLFSLFVWFVRVVLWDNHPFSLDIITMDWTIYVLNFRWMLVIYITGQHVLIFGLSPLSVCHIFQGNKFHIIVRCTFIYKFDKDTKESFFFSHVKIYASKIFSSNIYIYLIPI
jgi:hypothetical protein